jgi:hypothetical protein
MKLLQVFLIHLFYLLYLFYQCSQPQTSLFFPFLSGFSDSPGLLCLSVFSQKSQVFLFIRVLSLKIFSRSSGLISSVVDLDPESGSVSFWAFWIRIRHYFYGSGSGSFLLSFLFMRIFGLRYSRSSFFYQGTSLRYFGSSFFYLDTLPSVT